MIGLMELLVLIALLGPGGLLLVAAFSPLGPLLRYWMFRLFALTVAIAIAMHAGGGAPR